MGRPERPAYSVKVAETKDEIEACYDLRVEVFVVEQGFPLETEVDELDPESIHFLLTTPVSSPPDSSLISILPESLQPAQAAFSSSTPKPIGTIRLVPRLGKVSRLVVAKEYRQYGFGRVLVEAVDKYVKGLQGDRLKAFGTAEDSEKGKSIKLALHSQMQVVGFYSKLGYEPVGEIFDEEGAPHQKMVKKIALSS